MEFAEDMGSWHCMFELAALSAWLSKKAVHPLTREPVTVRDGFLVPLRRNGSRTAARVQRFVPRHRERARRLSWVVDYSGLCFHASGRSSRCPARSFNADRRTT